MKNINKKLLTILTTSLLFSLCGCKDKVKPDICIKDSAVNNIEPREETPSMPKESFISTKGLTEADVINDYKLAKVISNRDSTGVTNEFQTFKTSDELKTFCSSTSEDQDEVKINYLSTLCNEDFDNYELIVSPTLLCNYDVFHHTFANVYLKDNILYIHLIYHNYLPEDTAVDCVCGFEFYSVFIKKSVQYTSINTIIERETDYR